MTDDFSIGDVIRAAIGSPLDAIVKADELAIEEQVRAPTDNELAELQKLASQAAELQDELRAAIGDKQQRLKILTSRLKDEMMSHGMKDITIAGRPPIELTERKNRKPTQKAIVAAMQEEERKKLTADQLEDPKEKKKAEAAGRARALHLWNSIEPTVSQSISIPDPSPPEVDAPY